jgi:predicted PurR-regulated permease PerM
MNGDLTASRVMVGTLTAVAVATAMYLGVRFGEVLVALFIGMILSAALRPPVAWLERRGMRRAYAVALVHLVFVVAAGAILFFSLPLFAEQAGSLYAELPQHYKALRQELRSSDSQLLHRLGRALPRTLDTAGQAASVDAFAQILAWASSLASAALTVVGVLVLSFYWTLEGEVTLRSLLRLVPEAHRETVHELVIVADAKLAGYVRGLVICCTAVGLLAAVAYEVIGLPNAFALALIAGLLEAVPIIGPILGAIPAGLVALSIDPTLALYVALATLGIQMIENYLLVPRVMDSSVGVNALVTILAITAFGSLLGVVGAVLAIPLAALIQVVIGRFVIHEDGAAPTPPPGRDRVSALRYEIQDLVLDLRRRVRNKDEAAELDRVEEEVESIAIDLDRLLAGRDREAPP